MIPRTQNAVLAEKFADFEFGVQIRVWQAEVGRSYRVTS